MTEQTPILTAIARALAEDRLTINALDDGSGVVLDLDKEQLLTMNATGITIMESIQQGTRTEQAIVDILTARFDVSEERARTDTSAFIEKLAETLKK